MRIKHYLYMLCIVLLLVSCDRSPMDETASSPASSEASEQESEPESEPEQANKPVPKMTFSEYYTGFHIISKNEFDQFPQTDQLIFSEINFRLWVESNYPELGCIVVDDENYRIDWDRYCLLIHSSYPVSEDAIVMHRIESVSIENNRLNVIEDEDQTAIIASDIDPNNETERLTYFPYQLVLMEKESLTDEVCRQYQVTYEAQLLKHRNIYMGFHSLRYGDYTVNQQDGLIATITSEEAFDTYWKTYFPEISVHVLTRAQPRIDWTKETLLVYLSTADHKTSVTELYPIEAIYQIDGKLYFFESTNGLYMPDYPEVYDHPYQPYQFVVVPKEP